MPSSSGSTALRTWSAAVTTDAAPIAIDAFSAMVIWCLLGISEDRELDRGRAKESCSRIKC